MKTTINVRTDILEKITCAAKSRCISRSEMIAVLMKKVMDDIADPVCIGRMVRYQERNSPDLWHTFHLQIREDEYEYFLDLRKILKMSVSLILAYAVDKFLEMIMKSNISDNYLFKNYVIIKEIIDSITCWRFIWGFPPNIEKLFNTIT